MRSQRRRKAWLALPAAMSLVVAGCSSSDDDSDSTTTDTSVLTAIGNDYGFEQVFARQLAGKATGKDVFLGITTSGESANILKALEQCRRMDIPSIVFTGRSGGRARELADFCIVAPGSATSTIQELHIVMAHTLCECVEAALFEPA